MMARLWTAVLLLTLLNGGQQTFALVGFECPRDESNSCIEGIYTNPDDPESYWDCSNINQCSSVLTKCPQSLEFDDMIGTCTHSNSIVCGEDFYTDIITTSVNLDGATRMTTTTTISMKNAAPIHPIALAVARITNQTEASEPLILPEEVVNLGDGWDSATNIVTCPNTQPQAYFIHLNAGCMEKEQVNLNLRGASNADIFRNSTAHTGIDTIGRDIIQTIQPNGQLFLESQFSCVTPNLYSDSGRHTSFTLFNLEAHLDTTNLRIFSAARLSDYSFKGELPFDDVLVNIGGLFHGERYTVDVAGYYYFTSSIGLDIGSQMRAQLKVNDDRTISEMRRTGTEANGVDVISTSGMMYLNFGDYVYVNYLEGELHSDHDRQTSFGGFRYDAANITSHAWSVYRTTSIQAPFNDPIDPLTWDGIHVNTGLFSAADNHVHITQTGLYYVDLHVGVDVNATMDAFLVRADSRTEFDISRSSGYMEGIDVMSQGILLEMNEFETLKIVLGEDAGSYSDANIQTIWTGFLLTEKTFH